MVRGIERRAIFRDRLDREDLAARMSSLLSESGTTCLGIAFMPNHIHVLLRSGEHGLSTLMARLGTGYALRFNRRHDRVGHLFQNRFRSIAIESDSQLLATIRYVHLNPLRAGIVSDLNELERYPWTGHAALLGNDCPLPIHADEVLAFLDCEPGRAHVALRQLMATGADARDPAPTRPSPALEGVVSAVTSALAIPRERLEAGSRRRDVSRARALLAHLAGDRLGLPNVEVAGALGMTEAGVRRARMRGARLVSQHPWLSDVAASILPRPQE